ncbi:hypothetical protein PISMIDRAFT_69913, partial [Pisolithus microcarpus 441]
PMPYSRHRPTTPPHHLNSPVYHPKSTYPASTPLTKFPRRGPSPPLPTPPMDMNWSTHPPVLTRGPPDPSYPCLWPRPPFP